jgi:hypothetical protein
MGRDEEEQALRLLRRIALEPASATEQRKERRDQGRESQRQGKYTKQNRHHVLC